MDKKVILAVSSILLLSFVSAYSYYPGYNGFSLSNFLNNIDQSTLILGTLFLIFFAVLNFALGKTFKGKDGEPNKPVTAILSLGISLLIIYGLNRSGLNYENWVYSIGIPQEILWTIIPWIIIAGLVLLFWKLKLRGLLVLGGLLILIGITTNIVYEKSTVITIGVILILTYGIWKFITRKKGGSAPIYGGERYYRGVNLKGG
ncbi:hypothetical protein HY212_02980 [Candidatus Pacearchaeota archaeon]|nr:hypothetical protein [Candidatus Pacearchaeota archaeon]